METLEQAARQFRKLSSLLSFHNVPAACTLGIAVGCSAARAKSVRLTLNMFDIDEFFLLGAECAEQPVQLLLPLPLSAAPGLAPAAAAVLLTHSHW